MQQQQQQQQDQAIHVVPLSSLGALQLVAFQHPDGFVQQVVAFLDTAQASIAGWCNGPKPYVSGRLPPASLQRSSALSSILGHVCLVAGCGPPAAGTILPAGGSCGT